MEQRIYEEWAATETTALSNAVGRATRAGFYSVRHRIQDITDDPFTAGRLWRVTLYGYADRRSPADVYDAAETHRAEVSPRRQGAER